MTSIFIFFSIKLRQNKIKFFQWAKSDINSLQNLKTSPLKDQLGKGEGTKRPSLLFREKMRWYGHTTIPQGTVGGGRRRDRKRKQ